MRAFASAQRTESRVEGSGFRGKSGRVEEATTDHWPLATARCPLSAARCSRGFTLVEMLVVIVIIGILASLVTGAALMARAKAKRAMVKLEIAQLEMALAQYKADVGEYPPDFANIRSPNAAAQADARNAVLRHLRKAFPRYRPVGISGDTNDWDRFCHDVSNHYFRDDNSNGARDSGEPAVDPNLFDAASALVFWLGGLPEQQWPAAWTPAGFHSDVAFPFRPGQPRSEPRFRFDSARIDIFGAVNTYYPSDNATVPGQRMMFSANTDPATPPYVYFRAWRPPGAAGQYEFGYVDSGALYPLSFPALNTANPAQDYAVPYLDQQSLESAGSTINFNAPAIPRVWRNQDSVQILFAGFDNLFGSRDAFGNIQPTFRFSRLGQELPRTIGGNQPGTLSEGNFDNITNFTAGTIEEEMQQ